MSFIFEHPSLMEQEYETALARVNSLRVACEHLNSPAGLGANLADLALAGVYSMTSGIYGRPSVYAQFGRALETADSLRSSIARSEMFAIGVAAEILIYAGEEF